MSAAYHSLFAAGEPSKVPFYVMGGLLVSWAVVLSAIGLSRPGFPGNIAGQRVVIGISLILVAGTVSSAVLTSTKPHNESAAQAAEPGGQTTAPPAVDTTKTPAPGGGQKLDVSADPIQLKFDQATLTAKAGEVTINFDNPSQTQHDVTIAQGSTKVGGTKTVTQGKVTANVTLKPGTYTFYCSVDGHRQAGMEGKLTVN